MKLPKDFLPEKDLTDKIEELKSSDPTKGLSLNELIIKESEFVSVSYHELTPDYLAKYYPYFEDEYLSDSLTVICGTYSTPQSDIFEFQKDYLPEKNLEGIRKNLKNINSYLTNSFDNEERIKALIKENFMVFIWLPPGYPKDSQPGLPGKIIQYYKDLGLKEFEKE